MLGLTQLCVLAAIRRETERSGAVDSKALREMLKTALNIKSSEQIIITINRLVARGFVAHVGVSDLKFVDNTRNRRIMDEHLALCNFALGRGLTSQ